MEIKLPKVKSREDDGIARWYAEASDRWVATVKVGRRGKLWCRLFKHKFVAFDIDARKAFCNRCREWFCDYVRVVGGEEKVFNDRMLNQFIDNRKNSITKRYEIDLFK